VHGNEQCQDEDCTICTQFNIARHYSKRLRKHLSKIIPQNYRVVLAFVLGVGSMPDTHQVRKRAKPGRYLRPYPHHVRHKLDPCPRSVPHRHRKPLESDIAPRTLVASISLIPGPIQMADFVSWVSNPEESHGPLMSVVTWSLVSIAGAFLVVRLWIRQHQRKLWLDDCTLFISWVSAATSRGKERLTHIV
jgi:hypothetical protein